MKDTGASIAARNNGYTNLREARRHLKQQNYKYQSWVFVPVQRSEWPPYMDGLPIESVMRSREFLVQIYSGYPKRLSICRAEINDNWEWRDNISWDEMQRIKDACGFGRFDAVECYPKTVD